VKVVRLACLLGCCFAASFARADPDYSPRVIPNPAVESQPLQFWAMAGYATCYYEFKSVAVERTAEGVLVSYAAGPPQQPTGCFTIMPPLTLDLPIGGFAPGSYSVRVVDATPGSTRAPLVVPFEVRATLGQPIPALGAPAIGLLGVAIVALATLVAARRRPR
jgi:hypothetical protein